MAADLSMWSSEAWSSAADIHLLERSREGSAEAFGELWRRHLPAAYAVAGRYRGRTAPEDIVAEASVRVFALIQEGRGPDEHFRAYLLSAVRTVAIDHSRRELRLVPTEHETLESLTEPVLDSPIDDTGDFDADLIREAFRGLSEKDQRVLWHTTVEGAAPRSLAPALGMSPNAVSAQAMRAREALRAHYLDACAARSVDAADSDECRWAISHLGAHVRGRLPKRKNARVEEHLASCPHAAAVADDLRAIHAEFPALFVPLIFLAGVATPGFVSAPALAGLLGGAAAAGPAVAAAGSGAAGLVSAGAATGGAAPVPASGGVGDTLSQLSGRASSVVAGVVIGLGLAAAGQVPVAAPLADSPPAVTTPSPSSNAPTSAPTASAPPAPSPTVAPSVVPSSVPTSVPASVPASVTTSVPSVDRSPAEPPVRLSPRPPTSTQTPTVPVTPTVKPSATSKAVISLKVVNYGRLSTSFQVRVSGVSGTSTIVITGGLWLTVHNSSWQCSARGATVITCTGQDGQVLLEQPGATVTVRVLVTDATGATVSRTFSLTERSSASRSLSATTAATATATPAAAATPAVTAAPAEAKPSSGSRRPADAGASGRRRHGK